MDQDIVDDVVTEEVSTDVQQTDDNDTLSPVDEAATMGWVDKDEYKGDPAKWVDAETFLERGRRSNPILKDQNERLVQRINRLEKEHRETAALARKHFEEVTARKDEELKNAMAALKRQRNEAIRNGEDDEAAEIEGRIDVLSDKRQELKQSAKPAPEDTNLILQQWVEEGNEWYETDPVLRRYADSIATELRASGETSSGLAFVRKVEATVKRDMAHKFNNQNRNRPSAVESGSSGTGAPKGKTVRDLPEEDRIVMKKMVDAGYTTQEQFLQDYDWRK